MHLEIGISIVTVAPYSDEFVYMVDELVGSGDRGEGK